ncbi:MAG TPA: glycosyltransferase family 4 protein [Casimicrobiaceae bacterium]|nr:glycosyltransferase family 4 protein [Casimicrobiaceae bacterium]
MKVLVATHAYSGNGAAIMLLAVLEHWIADLGWTVDVLLDLEREVPDELTRVGVNVFSTADPKDYDFALVNTIVSGHLVERFAPHTPTILWVHEGDTVLWSSDAPIRQWRYLFSMPSRIIFQGPWQSDAIFRSFLVGLPAGRVACVRNGLPPLPQGLKPKPKKEGMVRIVFVGGVYGRKRPHDLVDAVLELGSDNVECLFIGSTEGIDTIGSEHVEKIRAQPNRFRLLNELGRAGTLEYVLSADVFCLPSGDESQPIAPLEAATLGVPCLLTDLPAYVGTWRHGHNCLLNPVGDISTLHWNLKALIEDAGVRTKVVDAARELAKEFSIGAFFRRFDAELPI